MSNTVTTSNEQDLLAVWQQHVYSEFVKNDAKEALTTMSNDPYVLLVPVVTGGREVLQLRSRRLGSSLSSSDFIERPAVPQRPRLVRLDCAG